MKSVIVYQPDLTRTKKYGVTEKKKAELDALGSAVLDAQLNVEQYQAIVNSLSEKSLRFQQFLQEAEGERTRTLSNRDMVDNLVQAVADLLSNAGIANDGSGQSDTKTDLLTTQLKNLIDRLIYSADIINKLATLVVRRKARNPLISDELVSMISSVGKDANNAVALTLVALTSVFSAKASVKEAGSASALGLEQARNLYSVLTGKNLPGNDQPVHPNEKRSLRGRLDHAYHAAKDAYTQMHHANDMATRQLGEARVMLNKAQVKLKSLQSALSAGNAAALAS
jgi:hypothetical protein